MNDALLWDGFYDLNTARPLPGLSAADAARVQADTFRTPLALARRVGAVAVETVQPGTDNPRPGRRAAVPGGVGVPAGAGAPMGRSVDRRDGALYSALWAQAIKDNPDWVLVNSFNQWHAGTEIEPSVEEGDRYLTLTRPFADRFRRVGPVPVGEERVHSGR